MTHTCPNCGTLNQESYRYCSNCGTLLKVDAPTTSTEQPAPPTGAPQPDTVAAAGLKSDTPDWLAAPTVPYSYTVKTAPPDEQESEVHPVAAPASGFVPHASYGAPQPQTPNPPPPPAPPAGFEGYAPPPSRRSEGATYTPYGAGSVAALERPRDTRSWLMPVIVAAAVVLLGLVFVSGYLVLTNRGTGPQATTSPSNPNSGQNSTSGSLPANASEEDIIKDVVIRSNDEQIQAWRNLDEEILKGTRVGQVLTENIQMVRELKQNNMYAVPENQKLEIQDVQINGDKATVNTLEVWTVTFYRKSDNKPVQSSGPDTLTETYYLQKIDGKWMIYNLVIHDEKQKQEDS